MATSEQHTQATASMGLASTPDAGASLMIDVRGLNKYFSERRVLSDIDFTVKRGECVTVIGPSGSGKSTLIRCINYLETPTSGTITIDGQEITSSLSHAQLSLIRRELGMVFYNFNLFPHMTVVDNITLAPIRVRKLTKAAAEDQAHSLLAKVGLADKSKSYPSQLSGG